MHSYLDLLRISLNVVFDLGAQTCSLPNLHTNLLVLRVTPTVMRRALPMTAQVLGLALVQLYGGVSIGRDQTPVSHTSIAEIDQAKYVGGICGR